MVNTHIEQVQQSLPTGVIDGPNMENTLSEQKTERIPNVVNTLSDFYVS